MSQFSRLSIVGKAVRKACATGLNLAPYHTSTVLRALGSGILNKPKKSSTRLGSVDDFEPAKVPDPLGYEKEKQRMAEEAKMRKMYEKSKEDPELRKQLLEMELEKVEYKPVEFEKKHPKLVWLLGQNFFGQWIGGTVVLVAVAGVFLAYNSIAGNDDLVLKSSKLPFASSELLANRLDEQAAIIALNAAKQMSKPPGENGRAVVPNAAPLLVSDQNRMIVLHAFKASNTPYAEYVGNNHFLVHMNNSGKDPMAVVDRISKDNPGLKFTYDIIYQ